MRRPRVRSYVHSQIRASRLTRVAVFVRASVHRRPFLPPQPAAPNAIAPVRSAPASHARSVSRYPGATAALGPIREPYARRNPAQPACACIRVDINIVAARSVCISAAVMFPPTPCATACSKESDNAVCHAATPGRSLGGLVKRCGASLPAIFAGSSNRFTPCHTSVATNVVASATTATRTYVGAGANPLLRLSQRRSRPLGVSQIPNPILTPLPP